MKIGILIVNLLLFFAVGLISCTGSSFLIPLESNPISVVHPDPGPGTDLTEGGTGDVLTITLNSEPDIPVVIQLTPDTQLLLNGINSQLVLNFLSGPCPGSGDWCMPKTVDIDAVDDLIVEGDHTGTINVNIVGGPKKFLDLDPLNDVVMTISDNDAPSVSFSPSGPALTIVEGATDIYSLVLDNEPATDVEIKVTPDPNVNVNNSAVPIYLTFTAGVCPFVGNWCTAQNVTVEAIDNIIDDGDRIIPVTHAVTAGPDVFLQMVLPNADITIVDNDP